MKQFLLIFFSNEKYIEINVKAPNIPYSKRKSLYDEPSLHPNVEKKEVPNPNIASVDLIYDEKKSFIYSEDLSFALWLISANLSTIVI